MANGDSRRIARARVAGLRGLLALPGRREAAGMPGGGFARPAIGRVELLPELVGLTQELERELVRPRARCARPSPSHDVGAPRAGDVRVFAAGRRLR